MKHYILSLLFLCLAMSVQAQFRMVSNNTPSWTSQNDSTYTASISFSADQTGFGYLANQIDSTFRLFTGTEQLYRVDSVWNASFSSADLRVVEVSPTNGSPAGQVMVFDPDGRETLPAVPFGSTGSTAQLQAAVVSWNARNVARQEVCKVGQDPNLIPELETVDPATQCLIVRDTVNNITYEYDASLAVGSRWVVVNILFEDILSRDTFFTDITGVIRNECFDITDDNYLYIAPNGSDTLEIWNLNIWPVPQRVNAVKMPHIGTGDKNMAVGDDFLVIQGYLYNIENRVNPDSIGFGVPVSTYHNGKFYGTGGTTQIYEFDPIKFEVVDVSPFLGNILQGNSIRFFNKYAVIPTVDGLPGQVILLDNSTTPWTPLDTIPGLITAEIKDNYIYTINNTSSGQRISVYDYSNPMDVILIDSLGPVLPLSGPGLYPMQASGDYMIAVHLGEGFKLIDISDPYNLTVVDSLNLNGNNWRSLRVGRNFAITASRSSGALYAMKLNTGNKANRASIGHLKAGKTYSRELKVDKLSANNARIGGFNLDENTNPLIVANSDGVLESTNKVTLGSDPNSTYLQVKPTNPAYSAWFSITAPQVYDEDLVFRFLRGSGNSNRAFIRFDDYYKNAFGFGLLRGQDTTNYILSIAANNYNPNTADALWHINERGELRYSRYGQSASLISGTPATFPAFNAQGYLIESTSPIPEFTTANEPAAASGLRVYFNTDDNEVKISKDGLTYQDLDQSLTTQLPKAPVTINAQNNAWVIDTAGIIRFQDLNGTTVDYQFVLSPNTSIPLLINRYEAGDTMGIRMQAGETYLRNSTGEYSLTDIVTAYTGSLFENDSDTLDAGVAFQHITNLESAELEGFTATDSTLTYTATETKRFLLQYNANINFNAGSAGTWRTDIRPYVNAINIDRANSTGLVETAGADDDWRMLSGSAVVTLNTGDVISLRNTATIGINYILDNLNLSLTEL
jgi:hypothetical protein